MFTANNKIYSEAGKLLRTNNYVGFEVPAGTENITEEDVIISDMTLVNELYTYNNGKCKTTYIPTFAYADWKKTIIQWRYSNDDQIAIILNKDNSEEDEIKYQKMQEWRQWASALAHQFLLYI